MTESRNSSTYFWSNYFWWFITKLLVISLMIHTLSYKKEDGKSVKESWWVETLPVHNDKSRGTNLSTVTFKIGMDHCYHSLWWKWKISAATHLPTQTLTALSRTWRKTPQSSETLRVSLIFHPAVIIQPDVTSAATVG